MATIQGQLNTPRDSTFKTTEQTSRNIADVLADELSGIAQALGGSTDYDDLSHRPQINSVTLTGDKSSDDLSLAAQSDLTSIKATGTTNATGSTITSGTFFYLNGTLCQAKADIASGATFTLNTNYEVVTAGGLNSLNSALGNKLSYINWANPNELGGNIDYTFTEDSYFECLAVATTSQQTWRLDGKAISVGDSAGGLYIAYASGFAKAGQRLTGVGFVKYFELL